MAMWLRYTLLGILFVAIGAVSGAIYWAMSDLPEIKALEGYKPIESSFVYSADGKVLAEYYLERRSFVPYYNIPDIVKKAFIAIEDQRFYEHSGVDILGILRAAYKNLLAGGIVEGGSTITQQLTKMLFLKPEKSLQRKLKELIIALQIEKRYTKDEILGMYLNQTYFGTRAYGIEAASRTYFNKSTSELDVAEAALLAGLQKAPSLYSPYKNPSKALQRRALVLRQMLGLGFITKEQFDKANAEPLPSKPYYRKYLAPYFVEHLRGILEAKYGERLYTSGMKIYSTIDLSMQEWAEEAVQKGIEMVQKRVGPKVQAALIAIELKTGHIKAMVGGTDFWDTQFNRATMAYRQPGSAFKPFVYVSALEEGYSIDDTVIDGPISLPGNQPGSIWSPKNYDGEYRGEVTLKTALALSLNTATVRLANQIGINNVIDFAKRCGIKSQLPPYLSLALGSADVAPLEITSAYVVFATGKRVEPIAYEKIVARNGIVLEQNFPKLEDVLLPDVLEEAREMLEAVIQSGTAQRAKALKKKFIAGKTGTTNDFTDAWFIGFDENLVVGVWVGRDNHKPIGKKEAGATTALPIWMEFMKNLPSK